MLERGEGESKPHKSSIIRTPDHIILCDQGTHYCLLLFKINYFPVIDLRFNQCNITTKLTYWHF